MAQEVFNRYEFKYIIDSQTYTQLLVALQPYVLKDEHTDDKGFYTINNIYYDTADDLFYNETVNRQTFRQKLRLRTYNDTDLNSESFLEIKKKYKGVVNKRRTVMSLGDVYDFLETEKSHLKLEEKLICASNPQILKEIHFLADFYRLTPKVVLCYERQAFQGINEKDLRITFDKNLRSRNYDFRLEAGSQGDLFMPPDTYVFEVKVDSRIPFWLSRLLSDFDCLKQSFSKYSRSYGEDIIKEFKNIG